MADYLKNKIVVITGAGSGFGKLTAEKLIKAGSKVIGADIREERLKKVSENLKNNNFKYKKTDVTKKQDFKNLIQYAVDQFSRVDVLINDAGIMPLALLSDHKKAMGAWEKCIDIIFKGTLYGVTSVYDQMIKQGKGQIINLSSIYGDFPVYGASPYGAIKKAVAFMTDALQTETRGKIKFTTITPTGAPTHLNDSVINPKALLGALGVNDPKRYNKINGDIRAGKTSKDEKPYADPNNIKCMVLNPKYIADNIVYAINQPDGVNISNITVRVSNDYKAV